MKWDKLILSTVLAGFIFTGCAEKSPSKTVSSEEPEAPLVVSPAQEPDKQGEPDGITVSIYFREDLPEQ